MSKQNPDHYKTALIEVWDYIHENDHHLKAKTYLEKLIALKSNDTPAKRDRVQEMYDAACWDTLGGDPSFTNPFDR